jgi:hypothetical protein
MRLLLQSAMIFFGTLMAAGLLALGEPQPSTAARGPSVRQAQTVLLARAPAGQRTRAPAAR